MLLSPVLTFNRRIFQDLLSQHRKQGQKLSWRMPGLSSGDGSGTQIWRLHQRMPPTPSTTAPRTPPTTPPTRPTLVLVLVLVLVLLVLVSLEVREWTLATLATLARERSASADRTDAKELLSA